MGAGGGGYRDTETIQYSPVLEELSLLSISNSSSPSPSFGVEGGGDYICPIHLKDRRASTLLSISLIRREAG